MVVFIFNRYDNQGFIGSTTTTFPWSCSTDLRFIYFYCNKQSITTGRTIAARNL
jgi:hypothetical protein